MAPRHDHDAGGDADVLQLKAAIREDTWSRMSIEGVARFPRPDGRIPNFVGAEAAAERLRVAEAWRRAATVKSNPDSPQWPVRQRALEDGKVVYMAVPRLAEDDPFFLLDPDDLADTPRKSSSIKGAARSARTVTDRRARPGRRRRDRLRGGRRVRRPSRQGWRLLRPRVRPRVPRPVSSGPRPSSSPPCTSSRSGRSARSRSPTMTSRSTSSSPPTGSSNAPGRRATDVTASTGTS